MTYPLDESIGGVATLSITSSPDTEICLKVSDPWHTIADLRFATPEELAGFVIAEHHKDSP